MKAFLFIIKDKQPEVLTKNIFYSHIEHLHKSSQSGHLFIAGPLLNQDKIVQIIRASNMEDAISLVTSDPYLISGFYLSYECYEWLEANESNNWLQDTPRIIEMLKNMK